VAEGPDARVAPDTAGMARQALDSLRDRNFRSFLVGRALGLCGFGILPFLEMYYTSAAGGGIRPGDVITYGAAQSVGFALGNLGLGWIGDRWGHRVPMILGTAVQAATLGLLLTTAGPASCLAAYAGAGIISAAGLIAYYNLLLETCRHEGRVAHIMAGNLMLAPAGLLAPLAAGLVAERCGLSWLFAACLALSLASLTWFVAFVRDPRTPN
jgi:MFS family permease